MPATIVQDSMTGIGDAATGQASSSPSSLYRFYSTDLYGNLRVSHPDQEGQMLLRESATQRNAVHKMTRGRLSNGLEILALARQNGQIDLVASSDGRKLLSIVIDEMRVNIHRWVGLAIASGYIYSCTSAGLISQTKLDISSTGRVARSSGMSRNLPEPLQCCEFEPMSDPKFFAYGGEDVSLSVNNIQDFFSASDEDHTEDDEMGDTGANRSHGNEEEHDEAGGASNEAGPRTSRKRRRAAERRAKAKELMKGEIWRAKNLLADRLRIPVKAAIVSIAFLTDTKLVVGTKRGAIRLYEVGPQRKAVKEIVLFSPKVQPVKHLVTSHNDGQLIAADTTGRVYVVDWRKGSMLYKYEIFAGAVVSMCSVPPPKGQKQSARLITASAEKLLRLHSMPLNTYLLRKMKENGKIESVQFHVKGIKNVVWDGVIPESTSHTGSDAVSNDEEDEDPAANRQDDIWQNMSTIGEEEHIDEHRNNRRRI